MGHDIDNLPASIRRLVGKICRSGPRSIGHKLPYLRELELNYFELDTLHLSELLELSSPPGLTGQSLVSDLSIDFFGEDSCERTKPLEFYGLYGCFRELNALLAMLSQKSLALQVLRLRFQERKLIKFIEYALISSTPFNERMVDIVDGCSSLKRIELPIELDPAQHEAFDDTQWVRSCRKRGIEIWAFFEPHRQFLTTGVLEPLTSLRQCASSS